MTRPTASHPSIGILGVGYMGIATGLAFARRGRRVVAYDIAPRVRAALRRGRCPYREAGLAALLRTEVRRGRFSVVNSMAELAAEADVIFVCVPTPSRRTGQVDLRPLRAAVGELGHALRPVPRHRVVVVKSTVVPGTTEEVVEPLLRRASRKGPAALGVAVNPEFLSEGRMVRDALEPARIVVGVTDPRSRNALRGAYAGFPAPILALSPSGAELVKHASNAFLALKVSFANELSRWTEQMGGSVDDVAAAVGADPRIGAAFLQAGPGFGGSCFDKDLRAFLHRAGELGVPLRSAEAALAINREQTDHAFELVRASIGPLRGKRVALLGVAFKAGTDDVRESRAFPIVERLAAAGARVRLHDPAALRNFEREWRGRPGAAGVSVTFCPSIPAALRGADLAVVQVDWPEYRTWNRRWSRLMRTPRLVDLRRVVEPRAAARAGVRIASLGVGPAHSSRPVPVARRRRRRER
ncbi:MAG: UDP-glucose dehydrogenase family protein [Thermoplasmata archaeon]